MSTTAPTRTTAPLFSSSHRDDSRFQRDWKRRRDLLISNLVSPPNRCVFAVGSRPEHPTLSWNSREKWASYRPDKHPTTHDNGWCWHVDGFIGGPSEPFQPTMSTGILNKSHPCQSRPRGQGAAALVADRGASRLPGFPFEPDFSHISRVLASRLCAGPEGRDFRVSLLCHDDSHDKSLVWRLPKDVLNAAVALTLRSLKGAVLRPRANRRSPIDIPVCWGSFFLEFEIRQLLHLMLLEL